MISARDAGQFGRFMNEHADPDQLWGPLFICAALFIAILANFIFRLRAAQNASNANPLSFHAAWAVAGEKSSFFGRA
jgi:hypothetical protein